MDQPSPVSRLIREKLLRATILEVVYPAHRGAIGVRGSHEPLSWTETTHPTASVGSRHVFELTIPDGETIEVKLVRGEDEWANGRNYTLHAGDHVYLEPAFERSTGRLLDPVVIRDGEAELRYQVLLPVSYDEQDEKRYPVLYVQDGQSMWSTSQDPFGVWSLDTTLDQLLHLAVIEELIVVAIDTSEARLDRLGPVPDPDHGGGNAASHLRMITDVLKPQIDADFRTQIEPENTGVMGSSMGGLFSFFAAWTRPDVFGKAICLSSSFGWANREIVRSVQSAPSPRPTIYLDSGVALDAEAPRQDGFHDTRAMHRALGRVGYADGLDMHRLTFPGESHSAASWAARVAIPLQLLFPARPVRGVVAKVLAVSTSRPSAI